MIIDVRTPADPRDADSTNANSALPPVEFKVTKGATANLISIQDRQGVQDRVPTVSYRVYFLPAAFAPKPTGTTATVGGPVVYRSSVRLSGRNVASLVTDIKSPGLGTILAYQDAGNFGLAGYYYCLGVNREGREANPEHMLVAP